MADNDFEPSASERELAISATNQYMSYLRADSQDASKFIRDNTIRLSGDTIVPLADVNDNVHKMKALYDACKEANVRVPSFRMDNASVPLYWPENNNFLEWIGGRFSTYYSRRGPYFFDIRDFAYYLNDYIKRGYADKESRIDAVPIERSLEDTSNSLRSFLTSRISGASRWVQSLRNAGGGVGGGSRTTGGSGFGGSGSGGPGGSGVHYVTINVSTVNHGLGLMTSPAYFVRWAHFGHPTSPVTGPILPGRYLFGGSGPSLPTFTPDPVPVDIPPHTTISLHAI